MSPGAAQGRFAQHGPSGGIELPKTFALIRLEPEDMVERRVPRGLTGVLEQDQRGERRGGRASRLKRFTDRVEVRFEQLIDGVVAERGGAPL